MNRAISGDDITTKRVLLKPWRREKLQIYVEARGVDGVIQIEPSKLYQATSNPTPIEWRLMRELGVRVELENPRRLVDEWLQASEEVDLPENVDRAKRVIA